MQANRNTSGLMPPWKTGQSGNDYGTNKQYRHLLRTARIASPEMLQLAITCAKDTDAPWPARLQAISLVIDRAWGKPVQEFAASDDAPSLTVMHLVAMRAISDQLSADRTDNALDHEPERPTNDAVTIDFSTPALE